MVEKNEGGTDGAEAGAPAGRGASMGFHLGQRVLLDGALCGVRKMVGGGDAIVQRLEDGVRFAVDWRRVEVVDSPDDFDEVNGNGPTPHDR